MVECYHVGYEGVRWRTTYQSQHTTDSDLRSRVSEVAKGYCEYVMTLCDKTDFLPNVQDRLQLHIYVDSGEAFTVVVKINQAD